MDFDASLTMSLPESYGMTSNDFEEEEEINQNEIVNLLLTAFADYDEPSDDDSTNTSGSSHRTMIDETKAIDSHESHIQSHESFHRHHTYPVHHDQNMHSFPNPPPVEWPDPFERNFIRSVSSLSHNDTQNPLHQLRLLCVAKDRRITQLEDLCEEYQRNACVLADKLETSRKNNDNCEQNYQSISRQCEELIANNHQLEQTVNNGQQRIQTLENIKAQFEEKLVETDVLIDTIQNSVDRLQHIDPSEPVDPLKFQEKSVQVDEYLSSWERAWHRSIYGHSRKSVDGSTGALIEPVAQTETKRHLMHMMEDKDKLEQTCSNLQLQIRTRRERLQKTAGDLFSVRYHTGDQHSNQHTDNSLFVEMTQLKERLNEHASNEKHLTDSNEELRRKLQDCEQSRSKRSGSSSSSSSTETVITPSIHMKQIQVLSREKEQLKKDYSELEEKYEYEKHELQAIVEQLREDIIDLEKTKQFHEDLTRSGGSVEERLRTQFEFELKTKLDELHRILDKDYKDNLSSYKTQQVRLEQEIEQLKIKANTDLEQQSKEFREEIERMKNKQSKHIDELTNELDQVRQNDPTKTRLTYLEKEFEDLKYDYSNLNLKSQEALNRCADLEKQKETLAKTLDQVQQEKLRLKQTFDKQDEKHRQEIKQIHEFNEHQKQEYFAAHRQIDSKQIVESLKKRLKDYDQTISQYDDYRNKLEVNLQKLIQQRDRHKSDLKVTRQVLAEKDEECRQLAQRLNENHHVHRNEIIAPVSRKLAMQESNLIGSSISPEKELMYQERLKSLEMENVQVNQRLQEANRAVDLADVHLRKEIEKIQLSLEQEYSRRYDREHKQHKHELDKLRQQLTNKPSPGRVTSSVNVQQETEEIKKICRAEIDRLYRENVELSQHQAKLIDAHQQQMEIMKKDLDQGYNSIIQEFQREQARLQTRHDQLKHQLTDAQQIIEQLKINFNHLKSSAQEHRHQLETLQARVEHLIKLLDQSNETMRQERMNHGRKENEYQQTVSALQTRVAGLIKQQTMAMGLSTQESYPERRPVTSNTGSARPKSVPDFVRANASLYDRRPESPSSFEKARVSTAHHLDQLEVSLKNQIQTDLIQSRNTMMKDIRRELAETVINTLRSQEVPETVIEQHLLELDDLLWQMNDDEFDSSSIIPTSSSHSSVLSLQVTPHQRSSSSSSTSWKRSVECLYMTPSNNQKSPARCFLTLDHQRRPKSASNLFLADDSLICTSPRVYPMKLYRSEEDITNATEHRGFEFSNGVGAKTFTFEEEDSSCLGSSVRTLMKDFEQSYLRSSLDDLSTIHYSTATTLANNHCEDEEDPSIVAASDSHGTHKLVRNALQLFITPPSTSRTGT